MERLIVPPFPAASRPSKHHHALAGLLHPRLRLEHRPAADLPAPGRCAPGRQVLVGISPSRQSSAADRRSGHGSSGARRRPAATVRPAPRHRRARLRPGSPRTLRPMRAVTRAARQDVADHVRLGFHGRRHRLCDREIGGPRRSGSAPRHPWRPSGLRTTTPSIVRAELPRSRPDHSPVCCVANRPSRRPLPAGIVTRNRLPTNASRPASADSAIGSRRRDREPPVGWSAATRTTAADGCPPRRMHRTSPLLERRRPEGAAPATRG